MMVKGQPVLLAVKNWKKYQHYKDRNPPWIKLHWELLTSMDWVTLDDASRVLAVACMLVASRNDGQIRGDSDGLKYLERVAHLNHKPNLKPLIDCGFLEYASTMLARCYQDARPETETETQIPTEKDMSGKPDVSAPAKELLNFLNEKAGRAYKPVSANLDFIKARLKEGYTPGEMRQVIAKKCREWAGDEKMADYLRPATLFNKTKLAQYTGELVIPKEYHA